MSSLMIRPTGGRSSPDLDGVFSAATVLLPRPSRFRRLGLAIRSSLAIEESAARPLWVGRRRATGCDKKLQRVAREAAVTSPAISVQSLCIHQWGVLKGTSWRHALRWIGTSAGDPVKP